MLSTCELRIDLSEMAKTSPAHLDLLEAGLQLSKSVFMSDKIGGRVVASADKVWFVSEPISTTSFFFLRATVPSSSYLWPQQRPKDRLTPLEKLEKRGITVFLTEVSS